MKIFSCKEAEIDVIFDGRAWLNIDKSCQYF